MVSGFCRARDDDENFAVDGVQRLFREGLAGVVQEFFKSMKYLALSLRLKPARFWRVRLPLTDFSRNLGTAVQEGDHLFIDLVNLDSEILKAHNEENFLHHATSFLPIRQNVQVAGDDSG